VLQSGVAECVGSHSPRELGMHPYYAPHAAAVCRRVALQRGVAVCCRVVLPSPHELARQHELQLH